jgi:hypothetical protein
LVGVPVGERGAEGGQPDDGLVGLVAGEGDGPGVDESVDDGWGGSGGEGVAGLVVAVELVALL